MDPVRSSSPETECSSLLRECRCVQAEAVTAEPRALRAIELCFLMLMLSPATCLKPRPREDLRFSACCIPHAHTEPMPMNTPQKTDYLHLCSITHPFKIEGVHLLNKHLLNTLPVPITVLGTKEGIIIPQR